MNTWDNYNGQTQQIQTNKNREGGGKHSNLETDNGAVVWKGLDSACCKLVGTFLTS